MRHTIQTEQHHDTERDHPMMVSTPLQPLKRVLPGILLCFGLGLVASWLNQWLAIGSISITILLGIMVGNLLTLPASWQAGIGFSEKHILSVAIVLLGSELDFAGLQTLGSRTLILILLGMAVTILMGYIVGKLFKFDPKLALLLGIGNAVCGSSAIAATAPVLQAEKQEIGVSVTIVNLLGTIGLFLLPLIARVALELSDVQSGVLIGNTLQAVGQVSAAGFSIHDFTGQTATMVKMGRILMLGPLLLLLPFLWSEGKKGVVGGKRPFPLPAFIIGFVLLAVISTLQILPQTMIGWLGFLSKEALIIAMAGIGLNIKLSNFLQEGIKALWVGGLVFVVQIAFTLCALLFFF